MRRIRQHLTFANVVSVIALFVAIGGAGAYASGLIGPNDIRDNAVRSRHIKNHQVKPSDLAKPQALQSAGLPATTNAGNCTGLTDEWASVQPNVLGPVGYYRDVLGRVHLNGIAIICGSPGGVIFKLPRGYRPRNIVEQHVALRNYVTAGRLSVSAAGDVAPGQFADGDTFSLAGIDFRCGPSGHNGCP
jgi:hypothetical protein